MSLGLGPLAYDALAMNGADLLTRLGVPEGEVKTAFVNNRCRDEDYQLRDGDRVAFFPPVAGG